MGHRTVVILSNDRASEWENDPELGKKIARAMNHATGGRHDNPKADLGYGQVVECAHADCQTVAIIDSLSMTPLHHGSWRRGETDEAMLERLFRETAEQLGFEVKKKAANVTKDGVEVRPGQVWKDCDTRMGNRHGKVVEVREGKVVMHACRENGQTINDREIRIALPRMRPTSTGWKLVRDVK